jgi:hypothetical protein
LYVVSILAHYASEQSQQRKAVSGDPRSSFLSDLSDFFDLFVLPPFFESGAQDKNDPEVLALAGSHTLVLCGFFREQMIRRHNLPFYDRTGKAFYLRASYLSRYKQKQRLFWRLARNFNHWTHVLSQLNKYFRDKPYLIN